MYNEIRVLMNSRDCINTKLRTVKKYDMHKCISQGRLYATVLISGLSMPNLFLVLKSWIDWEEMNGETNFLDST